MMKHDINVFAPVELKEAQLVFGGQATENTSLAYDIAYYIGFGISCMKNYLRYGFVFIPQK